jgi:glycerophosphoryl diester phosphodiesterase
MIEVIGHRGAAGLAPENTLASFRTAIALGVDAVEFDLHLSRDRELVVIHDDTLDRTTTGTGRIEALSLEEIRRADAGAKWGPRFAGERVPTLREVIDLVRETAPPRFRLNIELKFAAGRKGGPEGFEQKVLDLVREAGMLTRTTVQSFHHPSVALAKRLAPEIRAGLLVEAAEVPANPVPAVRRQGADLYAPNYRALTPELIEKLHGAGIGILTWTPNTEGDLRRVLDLGVGGFPSDSITTDFPNRLVEILKQG